MDNGASQKSPEIVRLNELLNGGGVVFFGGAGVSTESGIPDFRSAGGLYSENFGGVSPETVLSHTYFIGHTADFYTYYRKNILRLDAKPNKAHLKLAELERAGLLDAVITQNIDGLHQKAGSKNVIELHGSVYRNYCVRCGKAYGVEHIIESEGVPLCDCIGVIKPGVVLYEESLDQESIKKAINYISGADVLLVGGTSLVVYPAAGLLRYYRGNKLVIINKSETHGDRDALLTIRRGIGETMGEVNVTCQPV